MTNQMSKEELINKAVLFAKLMHGEQKRKYTSVLYFEHLEEEATQLGFEVREYEEKKKTL